MIRTSMDQVKSVLLILCLALMVSSPAMSEENLEASFREFLGIYVGQIKSGNSQYLGTVHPNLPGEMRGFFIDVTLDMMKHADDKGLEPTITCRDYGICKVTWPQPGDSWASQSFILDKGSWQWLEY
jgi:hypothetical protein